MPPEIDGDDYFNDEPEANGDATPVGDVDSEAEVQPADDVEETEDYTDEEEDAEDADDLDGEEEEPEPEDAWLPGFENRFRVGEEQKAFEAHRALEAAYSRKDQEHRQQLAEMQAQFADQIAERLQPKQQEPTWQELHQQRGQLKGLAIDDPVAAFRYALETGDEGNISAVIETVATGDPDLGIDPDPSTAMKMQRAVVEAQTRQQMEEQRATLQSMQAERHAERAGQAFQQQYGELLALPEIQQEFSAVVNAAQSRMDTSSAESIGAFLEECMERTIGRVARNGVRLEDTGGEQETAPAQVTDLNAAKRGARLEGGVPTRAKRPAPKDESDDYGDDLLKMAQAEKPRW